MGAIIEKSGAEIATEIVMVMQAGVAGALIVEGPSDERFFSSRLRDDCYLAIGNGRISVETAQDLLDTLNAKKVVGVVDEDYDWLIGYSPRSVNIVKTDPRDLEGLLFRLSSARCVLAEYAPRSAVASHETAEGCSFLQSALTRAEPFGRVRMVNALGSRVCLRQMKPIRFHRSDWVYDVEEMKNFAVGAGVSATRAELERSMSELKIPSIWHCVRGHDLVDVFVGGLKYKLGVGSVDKLAVERILRQAIDRSDFESSMLARGLRAWETRQACALLA